MADSKNDQKCSTCDWNNLETYEKIIERIKVFDCKLKPSEKVTCQHCKKQICEKFNGNCVDPADNCIFYLRCTDNTSNKITYYHGGCGELSNHAGSFDSSNDRWETILKSFC
jgi:hypothetical protein